MLQLHLLQVHLQLLGDQHRDGGIGALAHLDIGHGQHNLPIAADAHERVRRETIGVGGWRCAA
jgi:muramoyltetrapeptide carboxypeptidase LdcA involved in peptidoglycan recycling